MIRKLTLFAVAATTLIPAALFASTATNNICDGANISGNCNTNSLNASVAGITETLLTVAGAIAVIIIIVGGLTYITSSGDSSRIKQAKDIILYAVIGLIVAILAFAIVKFVAGNIH
jgi:TRAP-type C4-dicarboxylate transport system permease small subunit